LKEYLAAKFKRQDNMIIKKGDKAPDFTLHASDTSEVSLSDYEGKKVILLFFPCTGGMNFSDPPKNSINASCPKQTPNIGYFL
jgi:peroxiredoxin